MKIPSFSLSGLWAQSAQATTPPKVKVYLPDNGRETRAREVVARLQTEVPDALVISVVETETQHELASMAKTPTLDLKKMIAANSAVVQRKQQLMRSMGTEEDALETIIVVTTSQYHVIQAVNNSKLFIYLSVEAEKASLGLLREVMRRSAQLLVA